MAFEKYMFLIFIDIRLAQTQTELQESAIW